MSIDQCLDGLTDFDDHFQKFETSLTFMNKSLLSSYTFPKSYVKL